MIPLPTDIVVLEAGKFTVESREYDILAYKKCCNNEIDLSVEDFFKMKNVVKQDGKLWAVKHVKESAKCGLKEAKDFVDTYCDCVQND
jgi:ribosomal protein L7/L12